MLFPPLIRFFPHSSQLGFSATIVCIILVLGGMTANPGSPAGFYFSADPLHSPSLVCDTWPFLTKVPFTHRWKLFLVALAAWLCPPGVSPRGMDSLPDSTGGLGLTSWILQEFFSIGKKANLGHCCGSKRMVARSIAGMARCQRAAVFQCSAGTPFCP